MTPFSLQTYSCHPVGLSGISFCPAPCCTTRAISYAQIIHLSASLFHHSLLQKILAGFDLLALYLITQHPLAHTWICVFFPYMWVIFAHLLLLFIVALQLILQGKLKYCRSENQASRLKPGCPVEGAPDQCRVRLAANSPKMQAGTQLARIISLTSQENLSFVQASTSNWLEPVTVPVQLQVSFQQDTCSVHNLRSRKGRKISSICNTH